MRSFEDVISVLRLLIMLLLNILIRYAKQTLNKYLLKERSPRTRMRANNVHVNNIQQRIIILITCDCGKCERKLDESCLLETHQFRQLFQN